MRTSTLFLIALLLRKQDPVQSVRLIELRVPTHAAEGEDALLGCEFDMEDDVLYSVKWYKDKREFYRYTPKNVPPIKYFYMPGVLVDMNRSSSNVVTLVHLTKESEGLYRCEVSGEVPFFTTDSDQKYISIHLLPENGPQITGYQTEYKIGDRAVVNCTSSGSRPETQLKWLLNDQPVPKEYLQGPWYRLSAERSDAMITILQMRFTVMPSHFKHGIIKLKCHATIAPLYQQVAEHKVRKPGAIQDHVLLQESESDVKTKLTDAYKELGQTTRLELPLATTEPPNADADPDYAIIVKSSISTILAFIILLQII